MSQTLYFKRYRMEADLTHLSPVPDLPAGHVWLPWEDELLEVHARVKYLSFADELDSTVFPSLGSEEGCTDLMRAIVAKPGFCPAATWLIAGPEGYCGTVQGLSDGKQIGAIQNLGVVPECRGLGFGAALLLKALHGFRESGLKRASLEVTAQNDGAVRIYRRVGFRCFRTVYRGVEVDEQGTTRAVLPVRPNLFAFPTY